MSQRNRLSYAAVAIAGLSAAVNVTSASATVLTTEVGYYEDGAFVSGNSNSSDFSSYTGHSGEHGVGTAYSAQNGILNVNARTDVGVAASRAAFALPDPSGAVSVIATSRWEDTITNNTGTQVDYKYIFHVTNPRVGTAGNEGDYAALALDIWVDGVSVWSAFIEMDVCDLSYDSSYSAINSPGMQGSCWANFADFDAAASLGTYAAGSSFNLVYEMKAYANSSDTVGLTYAAVGDPAFIQGNPLQVIATPVSSTDVPEPAALALFGLGLAGLGLMRRRRTA